jgi:hypothetical protein
MVLPVPNVGAVILITTLGVSAVLAIGATVLWPRWVAVVRDAKAGWLRRQRPQAHKPVAIRVPPVVNEAEPASIKSVGAIAKTSVVLPRPTGRPKLTTYSAAPLLSLGENAFFQVLREAIGTQFHIALKPRLADLVTVRGGRGFYRAFNQVAMKHIDFILLEPQSMSVVLLIELDDKTHRLFGRMQRDALVDRVCREAGLRIIHIKTRASYQPEILRKIIMDRLVRD